MLPSLLILRKNVLTARGRMTGGVILANLDVTPGLQEAQCHRHQTSVLRPGWPAAASTPQLRAAERAPLGGGRLALEQRD